MILHEVLHELKYKKQIGIIMKIDFEKKLMIGKLEFLIRPFTMLRRAVRPILDTSEIRSHLDIARSQTKSAEPCLDTRSSATL